ncbi:MAG TPA: hypothetical protein DIC64_03135 [Alphaproteobacteria bacterium]|nr:hypothetical protein [Alphaproteobacteria bacterium]
MSTAGIILVIALVCVIIFVLFAKMPNKAFAKEESSTYVGKAKLTYKFTDEDGCFLCEFEKNGKKISAVYGFDKPDLKVGDEVQIVWNGMYCKFPHVMDKEVYDREMEINAQINANQGRGELV